MPRIPLAMGRLIDQVSKINPKVEVSFTEPDGFNVYRRVQFDKQTLKSVGDALRLVAAQDARITKMDSQGIQFVTTIDADRSDEFGLPQVQAILKPAVKDTAPKRERQAATKKASAKKAAKKS